MFIQVNEMLQILANTKNKKMKIVIWKELQDIVNVIIYREGIDKEDKIRKE